MQLSREERARRRPETRLKKKRKKKSDRFCFFSPSDHLTTWDGNLRTTCLAVDEAAVMGGIKTRTSQDTCTEEVHGVRASPSLAQELVLTVGLVICLNHGQRRAMLG